MSKTALDVHPKEGSFYILSRTILRGIIGEENNFVLILKSLLVIVLVKKNFGTHTLGLIEKP